MLQRATLEIDFHEKIAEPEATTHFEWLSNLDKN